MHPDRRTHLFAFGFLSSFAAIMLALATIPTALYGEHTELLESSAVEPKTQGALLYLASGDRVARSVVATTSGRSIVVDLEEMTLRLFEGERQVGKFRVLSKGREGTFWETPEGEYEIRYKVVNHFSSIGEVWMPYSMQFYGNFFIHGWPYQKDGTPVSPGYSGGCIRLSTEDAKKVYQFSSVGTPVVIRGAHAMVEATSTFAYYLRDPGDPPKIGASGIIVADMATGQILWERRGLESLPMHGISALMTALTAVETVNQYKVVRMSELLLGKPTPRSAEGKFLDEVPIGALIYPLVFSANDTAAKAFAADKGEHRFVLSMNEKARAIGMRDTVFASSTVSEDNRTTPRDVFQLLRYLRESKPFILGATLREEHIVNEENSGKERYAWTNDNPWRGKSALYRGGILPKDAGARSSAAAIWDIPLAEFGERPIAFIVLDTPTPKEDIDAMRAYVERTFIFAPVLEPAPLVVEKADPTPSLWSRIRRVEIISSLLSG